jgi:hypothetical protein
MLLALLATGIPAWPSVGHTPTGSFDWSPILFVFAALLLAPIVFGIRLTTRSLGVLVLGGIGLGWLDGSIGVLPAVCVGLLALSLASAFPRSRRRGTGIVQLPE